MSTHFILLLCHMSSDTDYILTLFPCCLYFLLCLLILQCFIIDLFFSFVSTIWPIDIIRWQTESKVFLVQKIYSVEILCPALVFRNFCNIFLTSICSASAVLNLFGLVTLVFLWLVWLTLPSPTSFIHLWNSSNCFGLYCWALCSCRLGVLGSPM